MSTASGAPDGTQARRRGGSRVDVASLVLAGLLVVMGATLALDASTIQAPRGGGSIGPAAFPWAVAGILLALAVALGLVALRGRPDELLIPTHPGIDELRVAAESGDRAPHAREPGSDSAVPDVPVGGDRPPLLRGRAVLRVAVFAAGLLAHALLINTVGYVVAALVLFVAVALAFGAPRLLPVALIGLVMTLVIFYSFTVGLGLSLPDLGGR